MKNQNSGEHAVHTVSSVSDCQPLSHSAAEASALRLACSIPTEDEDSRDSCGTARNSARRGSLWQYPTTTVPVWDDETQMLVLKVSFNESAP